MDTGKGNFKMLEEDKYKKLIDTTDGRYLFRVGEEVELKGSKFKVKSIQPDKLILKLLKRKEE
jgi:uncharacterized Zn finger protein